MVRSLKQKQRVTTDFKSSEEILHFVKRRSEIYYTCPTHQRDTTFCAHLLEIRQNNSGASI